MKKCTLLRHPTSIFLTGLAIVLGSSLFAADIKEDLRGDYDRSRPITAKEIPPGMTMFHGKCETFSVDTFPKPGVLLDHSRVETTPAILCLDGSSEVPVLIPHPGSHLPYCGKRKPILTPHPDVGLLFPYPLTRVASSGDLGYYFSKKHTYVSTPLVKWRVLRRLTEADASVSWTLSGYEEFSYAGRASGNATFCKYSGTPSFQFPHTDEDEAKRQLVLNNPTILRVGNTRIEFLDKATGKKITVGLGLIPSHLIATLIASRLSTTFVIRNDEEPRLIDVSFGTEDPSETAP